MGRTRTAALSAGAASPKGMDTAKSGSIDLNMNMTTKMMFFYIVMCKKRRGGIDMNARVRCVLKIASAL